MQRPQDSKAQRLKHKSSSVSSISHTAKADHGLIDEELKPIILSRKKGLHSWCLLIPLQTPSSVSLTNKKMKHNKDTFWFELLISEQNVNPLNCTTSALSKIHQTIIEIEIEFEQRTKQLISTIALTTRCVNFRFNGQDRGTTHD